MHGMQREPIPGGDGVNEWNYLIIYSTDSKKQNGVNPKMWNNLKKKWGNDGEIREMRNNLETTLITYAASNNIFLPKKGPSTLEGFILYHGHILFIQVPICLN